MNIPGRIKHISRSGITCNIIINVSNINSTSGKERKKNLCEHRTRVPTIRSQWHRSIPNKLGYIVRLERWEGNGNKEDEDWEVSFPLVQYSLYETSAEHSSIRALSHRVTSQEGNT